MTSKITKSAKGRLCTVRIPGVCNHDSATTVWAHIRSIRFGAGVGKKSHVLIGCYACSNCHDAIDRRHYLDRDKEFVRMCAWEGHGESLMILEQEGIVRV